MAVPKKKKLNEKEKEDRAKFNREVKALFHKGLSAVSIALKLKVGVEDVIGSLKRQKVI